MPGVRQDVSTGRSPPSHPGNGGGSHQASSRRLATVYRPCQSPELVQAPPRPKDGSGTGGGAPEKCGKLTAQMSARLRPRAGMCARVRACACSDAQDKPKACDPAPTQKSFGQDRTRPHALSFARKFPRSEFQGGAALAQQTTIPRCGHAACQNRTQEGGCRCPRR